MGKVRWYYLLLTTVFTILGILTLIPAPASKPNLIGYYSHCSFTPASTIICWIIAGVFYWIGKKRAAKP